MERSTLVEIKNASTPSRPPVYTTGEAAAKARLSQQTIIRCFDSGRIKGFRVPGSTSRRIPHEALIRFMKDYGIPIGTADDLAFRILIIDDQAAHLEAVASELANHDQVGLEIASIAWNAGFLTAQQNFDLILVSARMAGVDAAAVAATLRDAGSQGRPRVVAFAQRYRKDEQERLRQAGVDDFLWSPLDPQAVMKLVPKRHL